MIDTAARMRYVYIRTYAGQRPSDEFTARAATIRGRLLFFCASATCGYYSRAATIRCAAIIRINTVYDALSNLQKKNTNWLVNC